jgi:hypothetical protein
MPSRPDQKARALERGKQAAGIGHLVSPRVEEASLEQYNRALHIDRLRRAEVSD